MLRLSVLLLFVFTNVLFVTAFKRICYYSIQSANQTNALEIEKINGTLCTHILIGFATTINDSLVLTRPDDALIYERAVKLKLSYPSLSVMLSVGGGGNDGGFHDTVSSNESRAYFIQSVLDIMDEYSFDGLDIDWEFPAWQKHPEDKDRFIYLLRDLYAVFKSGDRAGELQLSVAVAPAYTIIVSSYDIVEMHKYVDFINLMSYDFHDYSNIFPFTAYNAPLYKRSLEQGYLATLNTNWSALYWNQWGMSRDKIMVGIPTYSHSYVLADPDQSLPGSPATGTADEFTFSQVCDFLAQKGTQYVFDNEAMVPYAHRGLLWISFDDRKSVTAKANWIKDHDFGGAMTYDLNCDDFINSCNSTLTFPLHQIIYNILP